jgi:four helix bundle protein
MASHFRQLAAYRLSAALADELYAIVRSWPAADRAAVGAQLTRAIDSVGANIAESAGRWHAGEKRQFFIVARGSLYEAEYWIGRAEARGLIEPGTSSRVEEIARTLSGLIKKPTPG